MKKLVLTLLIGLSGFAYANINTVVSILPQKTFVEAIGGDKVNVSLMVKPGNSPHSYEPKPSQMKEIADADIYFAIDVEFENAWLPRFKSHNKNMKIVDLDEGITKIAIAEHSADKDEHHEHEDDHGHHNHDDHKHKNGDPHIWTSPSNVKIIAKNIFQALSKTDKKNKSYYEKNYKKFIDHISKTDKKIKKILSNVDKGAKFMVFHPAWGYFAKEYDLMQIAIESGGKSPKPKILQHLIKEAKEENVKAVFTAPEFSTKAAKTIADQLHIPVIKVSPLNPKWSQNLQKLAQAIANK